MPVTSPAPSPQPVETAHAVNGIPAGVVVGLALGLFIGCVVCIVRYLILHPGKLTRGIVCMMVLVVLLTPIITIPCVAFTKGMTPAMLADTGYAQMARATYVLTPQSPNIPDASDQGGHLYILYRFNCEACVDVHDDIVRVLEEENVQPYWVSTRSTVGRAFVQERQIPSVPCAVYVDENDPEIYYIEKLYPNERFNELGLLDLIRRYKDRAR